MVSPSETLSCLPLPLYIVFTVVCTTIWHKLCSWHGDEVVNNQSTLSGNHDVLTMTSITAYQLHTPVRFFFEWSICKVEVLIGICTFFSHSQSDGYSLNLHYQCTEDLYIVYNILGILNSWLLPYENNQLVVYIYVVCYYIITQRAIWLPNLAASLLVCSRSIHIKMFHQSQSSINESPTLLCPQQGTLSENMQ